MSDLIKHRLRENILHAINQSPFILLIGYAFDGLINMNPSSTTLFVNLCIVKFLNDIVLRSLMNGPGAARRSLRSGKIGHYDLVVPELNMGNYSGDKVPLHDYFTPSGTITLLTFYFSYLIMSMVMREEINTVRIVLYIIILLIAILYKIVVIPEYPSWAILSGLIFGGLMGVALAGLVGNMNINYLPSGINRESCPAIPTVHCSFKN
jgi:hypothetical protein